MDVNTAVIYSGRIESAPELLEKGSLCYRVTNVFLKSMDGDAEYNRIKTLLEQGQELEEVDLLKLIFLPLKITSMDGGRKLSIIAGYGIPASGHATVSGIIEVIPAWRNDIGIIRSR